MKFISWNVNGLRACLTHGFAESFAQLDADIFSVQETKMQPGQADFAPEGYTEYTYSAEKKGYSGTAIFSKREPLRVQYGMGKEEHDREGRLITLEFPEFYFATVYVPNSQRELTRLDYRMQWEDDFLAYLQTLDQNKPVIFCGDLNVAKEEIDLTVRRVSRIVKIGMFMDRYPAELSGGQQQRVAIARALALKPDILCFDEPTSALDPELTGEVLKVIRTLAEQKTTMIIVTHEMAFARDVADQLIFMDGGVIVEQGDPHQVIDHPKEERTKQFLTRYAQG